MKRPIEEFDVQLLKEGVAMDSPLFTQGPWFFVTDEKFGPEVLITSEKRIFKSIGAIAGLDIYFDEPMGSEQRANARLIKSAPRLFGLLEECHEMLTSIHKNTGSLGALNKAKEISVVLSKVLEESDEL